MNTKKVTTATWMAALLMIFCLSITSTFAQTKPKATPMKECCTMKDGKMMCMKDGKLVPMTKDMTMKDGTKCMVNGKCVMKNGKTMTMKNGDCMDMNGKMCSDDMKADAKMKTPKAKATALYHCPMDKDVTSAKPGKCPKCGMDLVKNK